MSEMDAILDDIVSQDTMEDGGESSSGIVFFLLIFTAVVSFWFQAVLTEERFVPSLNLISTRFNIPDDVAGATLMAAGASSPELFSSIVALFITHSALGLGTIVGSEIFNQLMICCGSIYASRGHTLVLDKKIIAREVGFYALSIFLLYMALSDSRPVDDDTTGSNHIYISFFSACTLFGGYIAYVLVCSYFESICALFGGAESGETEALNKSKRHNTPIDVPNLPFMKQVLNEPKENWKEDTEAREGAAVGVYGAMRASVSGARDGNMYGSVRNTLVGFTQRAFVFQTEKPSDQHDLHALESNEYAESLSCFMWQRSRFYSKAKVSLGGWQLRWFTFSHNKMISVPDRGNYNDNTFKYPPIEDITVDTDHLIISLGTSTGRSYVFMAPSPSVLEAVASKCEDIIKSQQTKAVEAGIKEEPEFLDIAAKAEEEEEEPSLIEFPHGAPYILILIHFILYPFKLAMHLTVPDTRHPDSLLSTGFLASFMCLVWLVIGSYAMVASLESLADIMNIPPAVVGVTVSAVGTSLPNYVGSQCAAKQGLGNMAVSNAFGSNTFNILVGLGLPWALYIAYGDDGPYHGLKDEGITESVLIMAIVLMAFVVMIFASNFVLHAWHANTFAIMYVVFIIYATAPYIFK